MTCCILGLLILMTVGRLRRAVGGGAPTPMLFAPVAQRPAPGQPMAAPVIAESGAPASAAVFGYAAFGMALCLVAVPVLAWTGALENTGSAAMWLLRGACYVALIAIAVLLSRSVPVFRNIRGAGWLLVVLGAVIFETGVLDMHLFGIIGVDHSNLLGDFVFHNVGPALAMIGGLALLYRAAGRRTTSRRSSRSTVSSARPSSSAVTVSSTPPATM
jgi:hypothetical protein